jgi:hypothetical protein
MFLRIRARNTWSTFSCLTTINHDTNPTYLWTIPEDNVVCLYPVVGIVRYRTGILMHRIDHLSASLPLQQDNYHGPGIIEQVSQPTEKILVKPWTRPREMKEVLDYAPLIAIDLSRFDEPGGKQELAAQLYDAITRVGFWAVTNTGIDDDRVLRQFSIGNTFFKEGLDEKRRFPCNFAEGEYFGYRENSRWIGDTGVKENIEIVSTKA